MVAGSRYVITEALEVNPLTAVLEPARGVVSRLRGLRAGQIQTSQPSAVMDQVVDQHPIKWLRASSTRCQQSSAQRKQHELSEPDQQPEGQRQHQRSAAVAAVSAALELDRTRPLTACLSLLPKAHRSLPFGVVWGMKHVVATETEWSATVSAMVAVAIFVFCSVLLAAVTTCALHPAMRGPLSEFDKARIARCRPRGVKNWRDLGGLATADGKKRVRTGVVFRSGHLHSMHPVGEQAEEMAMSFPEMTPQLRCVVDLREGFEIEQQPDQPASQRTHKAPFGIDQTIPVTARGKRAVDYRIPMMLDPNKFFRRGRGGRSMLEAIQQMSHSAVVNPTSTSPFAQLLQLASAAENLPLNLHCTSGSDRSGTASAVLLLALGVPEETAIHDYLLTNHELHDETWIDMVVMRTTWLMTGSWYSFIYDTEYARQSLGVQAETLQRAIDAVHAMHGGFTDAYWAMLGLDTRALSQLRSALLEPITPPGSTDDANAVTRTASQTSCSRIPPCGDHGKALVPPRSEEAAGGDTALKCRKRRRSLS